jgi:formylglycine-generating enzyme required for sulfatase activity
MPTSRSLLLAALPAAALAALLTQSPSPAQTTKPAGKRFALVVGVNDYSNRKLDNLKYAERDATELSAVLTRAGFTVRTLLGSGKGADEATRANVEKALADLLRGVGKKDIVLLAFSGHGQQLLVKEKNTDGKEVEREVPFFCPKDGVPTDAATLVSLNAVLKALDEKGGGHNLLLVDACRNIVDPNKGARGGINGARIDNLPEGTAVFFACSGRQKARETDKAGGGHGVFFHFVLEGLRGAKGATNDRGQVTWERLVPYVKERVKEEFPAWFADLPEEERQRPHAIGSLTDDPILVSPGGTAPPPLLDSTGEKGLSAAEVKRLQEAWAKHLGRQVEEEDEIAPGVKMKFVLVPPGRFRMGSPRDEKERSDDEVEHEVEITRPFYLGKYEVTQKQYEAVTGKNPSRIKGDDLPVESVSWEEADAFRRKLTEKRKDGLVYRLPSEGEWEYSCRGGRSFSQPFGIGDGTSLSSKLANFDGNYPYGGAEKGRYLEKTVRVGNYPANALGLHDMHGNVWEWCSDWYGKYPTGKVSDPTGPGEGSSRVFRGGGWVSAAWGCRAASRNGLEPGVRGSSLGFRLARVPSGLGK